MSIPLPTIASSLLTMPGYSFANTVAKLERMLADPLCTPTLAGSVIGSDPMLTALVLSRANAALPAGQTPMVTVSSGVAYLGLAIVYGLLGEVLPVPEHHRTAMAASWALANATGAMCRQLAPMAPRQLGDDNDAEVLHACGLLHDLGAVAIQLRYPEAWWQASKEVASQPRQTFVAALKSKLGLHHGAAGTLLASAWRLPPPISSCMRFHFRPEKAEDHQAAVALVHIARTLVRGFGFISHGDTFLELIAPEAMEILGFGFNELETALHGFGDEMAEMETYEGFLTTALGNAGRTGSNPIIS